MAKKLIGLYRHVRPATLGHIDIKRGEDRHLVTGTFLQRLKKQMFSLKARVDMMRHEAMPLAETRAYQGGTFDMLQVKFAHGRRDGRDPRSARGVGLRIRVPDGGDEPAHGQGDRDCLPGG
jgi:hypothetical protein